LKTDKLAPMFSYLKSQHFHSSFLQDLFIQQNMIGGSYYATHYITTTEVASECCFWWCVFRCLPPTQRQHSEVDYFQ